MNNLDRPDKPSHPVKPSRLPGVLIFVFAVALVMGPGPGLYLVNPDPSSPEIPATFLGLPIVYAWGLFWFAVEVAVLVVAYVTVWSSEDDA